MCAGEPAPIQTTGVLEERPLHQGLRDRALRERRDRARLEAGRVDDLRRARDARPSRAGRGRDLRLVGARVARHEREHVHAVADEHERLHDLRQRDTPTARAAALGGRRPARRTPRRARRPPPRRGTARPAARSRATSGPTAPAMTYAVVHPLPQLRDELGRGGRVDRERHQRLARPRGSARRPCSRC